jgi:hypothetical protein
MKRPLIILLIVCILSVAWASAKEQFSIYDHPTKCFSCEREAIRTFGPEFAWMGQNTKSFDAEREMIFMTGNIASAIDTHPIKYY